MDPNTAWWNVRKFMGALACYTAAQNEANRDHAAANEAATALMGWLDRGGYTPDGFNRKPVVAYCRDVVRRTRALARGGWLFVD